MSCFTILRTVGYFGPGGWQTSGPANKIQAWGVIGIAEPEALRQVPEGDRVAGAIQIVTTTPIYETLVKTSATSDHVMWQGDLYRVQSVERWKHFGFYSAILVRMTGT